MDPTPDPDPGFYCMTKNLFSSVYANNFFLFTVYLNFQNQFEASSPPDNIRLTFKMSKRFKHPLGIEEKVAGVYFTLYKFSLYLRRGIFNLGV